MKHQYNSIGSVVPGALPHPRLCVSPLCHARHRHFGGELGLQPVLLCPLVQGIPAHRQEVRPELEA